MIKYTNHESWFNAKCYKCGMSYFEYTQLARRLGIAIAPIATYDRMRSYLKKRTPEEMGELTRTDLANLEVTPSLIPRKRKGS